MHNPLLGKVALISGGSRGIGKGIAEVLLSSNATVYITGRKGLKERERKSVLETAEELNKMNKGKCYGIICDHKNDEEVLNVFKTIMLAEGRLDIMVNNAFSGTDDAVDLLNKQFWDIDYVKRWEKLIDVGVRSNYVTSCEAAKIMVKQKSGLIINISSFGGIMPLFNEVYGVGKEACDRMATEMGAVLFDYNVAMISLWPGVVRTEKMTEYYNSNLGANNIAKNYWDVSEHPSLTGKAILALATDPHIMKKIGKIHFVADLAHLYGFKDIDNVTPTSFRSLRFYISTVSPFLSKFIPHFIKVPGWLISAYFNKF